MQAKANIRIVNLALVQGLPAACGKVRCCPASGLQLHAGGRLYPVPVEIPGGVHPYQIVDQEIKQAVNNALSGKGSLRW